MKSSVVIIVRNSEATIGRCLQTINKQTLTPTEVIVVDSSTTNSTAIIAEENHAKVVKEPLLGRGRARNTGIRHAKGDIIVFVPADALFPPDWLQHMIQPFSRGDDNLAGVAGNIIAANSNRLVPRLIDITLVGKPHYATTNIAYRKRVLQEVGGFDDRLETADDVELAWRILRRGYRITYAPRAVIYHYHPETLRAFLKMQAYLGEWSMLARKLSGEPTRRQKLLIASAPLAMFKHLRELFRNPLLPPFLALSTLAYAKGLAKGLAKGTPREALR